MSLLEKKILKKLRKDYIELRKEYIELMNRNKLYEKRLDEIENTVGESTCIEWMEDSEASQ